MGLVGLTLLSLLGCDAFDKATETFEGLTDTLVTQGFILGVQAPDDPLITPFLEGSDFEIGTAVTVFLADASDVTDLDNAPVANGSVQVDGNAAKVASNEGGGLYFIDPSDDTLQYQAGSNWTVWVDTGGEELGSIVHTLPPTANVSVPAQWTPNTAMNLSIAGQGFDNVLVVVLDDAGSLTYSNEPVSIQEIYDFSTGGGVDEIALPGSAFPGEGVFAVGIAGMTNSESQNTFNMNTALSSLMAGEMVFHAVATLP